MATANDIVNFALTKLGQETVSDYTADNNARARVMNSLYDIQRKALLRQYRWAFSKKRASLASLTTTPEFGYAYEYQLPTDCLQLILVNGDQPDPNWTRYNENPIPEYVVEGRKILSGDEGPIEIIYVSDAEEAGDFDAAFVEAFATKLAREGCMKITQSRTQKQALDEDYATSIQLAIRANAIERPSEMQADTTWVLDRL